MRLSQLSLCAASLEAHCIRGAELSVSAFAEFASANADHIVFLSNIKHIAAAQNSLAGALVTSHAIWAEHSHLFNHHGVIVCKDPYAFFAFASQSLEAFTKPKPPSFVHPTAVIHPSAVLEADVTVGPYAVIEANCVISNGSTVGAHCSIGEGALLGANVYLYPHVTVYQRVQMGQRCIVHSGTVIGSDGFGFAPHQKRWVKIPQTGTVILGDDVEIGSNCSIDRGALGNTVIGRGTKLDNLIQIAHNVHIGEDCAFAANIAIAGSAVLGNRIQIGGNAGVLGHLSVCDDVVISSCTLVTKTISKPGFYSGVYPIQENAEWEKNAVLLKRLSKMRDQMRALEKQLKV